MTAGKDLTRLQRLELARKAEERAGLADAEKALDFTGAYVDAHGDLAWRAHPTGLLVHGPDSSEIIDRAQHKGKGGSALWAVISSYIRAYKEPQLHHQRGPWMQPDRAEIIADGALADLLRDPHPRLTMNAIKTVTRWTLLWHGRAYLLKRRTGTGTIADNVTGAVAELWPVDATRMRGKVYGPDDPRRPMSNGWVDYYSLNAGRGRFIEIPPENVIEFTLYPDPADPRVGLKPIAEIVEEIASDAQANALYRAVLSNLGVPGLVIAPKPTTDGSRAEIPKDDRDALRDAINARTTGEKRGSSIVMSKPVDFYQFQSNLEALKLDHVWRQIETRISGNIGWPAVLAGLGVGLDDANRATINGLKEHATESVLVPAWTDDGEAFTQGLRDDFALGKDDWIGYAWHTVRALQTDTNDRWRRVGEAWQRGEINLGQHHELLGLELPADVDPTLRRPDIEAASQLTGLLGPALGKAWADRILAKGSDLPLLTTEAGGAIEVKALSAADSVVTEGDIDEAIEDWDSWARANAPQYEGMLDAEEVEGEEDEG